MFQSADLLERHASAAEALSAAHGGLSWIAAADPAGLTSEERGDLLRGLIALDSVKLAADTAVLGAFHQLEDYAADGQASAAGWAAWQARTSRQSVAAKLAWWRKLAGRPHLRAALAAGLLSVSWASQILAWLG